MLHECWIASERSSLPWLAGAHLDHRDRRGRVRRDRALGELLQAGVEREHQARAGDRLGDAIPLDEAGGGRLVDALAVGVDREALLALLAAQVVLEHRLE